MYLVVCRECYEKSLRSLYFTHKHFEDAHTATSATATTKSTNDWIFESHSLTTIICFSWQRVSTLVDSVFSVSLCASVLHKLFLCVVSLFFKRKSVCVVLSYRICVDRVYHNPNRIESRSKRCAENCFSFLCLMSA